MPNALSLLPSSLTNVTHDPTVTLEGDPMGVIGDNPYGTMTNALIFGAVNTLLGWIDDATGLDLLPFATAIEGLLGGPINLLSGFFGFLTPGMGTTSTNVLSPLTSLFGVGSIGALPNVIAQLGSDLLLLPAQAPMIIGDLIASIFGGWTGAVATHNPVSDAVTAIEGVLGIGSNAQAVNAVQDAKINSILAGSGAVSIFDTFGGAAASTLDPTWWDQHGSGPGAGTFGTDGNSAIGTTSGFLPYSWLNRHLTPLNTDTHGVAVVLNNNLASGGSGTDAGVRIQGRMDATTGDRVDAILTPGNARFAAVVGGVSTNFGTPVSMPGGVCPAGVWELDCGTTSISIGPAEFVLSHNGSEFARATDDVGTGGAPLSLRDASHRFVGFEADAGVTVYWWVATAQYWPPPIGSFAAADRIATP